MTSQDDVTFRFNHVGMSVADLNAQREWYGRALGLVEVVSHDEFSDPKVRIVLLQAPNGNRVELIEREGSARVATFADPLDSLKYQGYVHLALSVDDLDAAWSRLLANGARAALEPSAKDASHAAARFGYVSDPEGNLIELIESPPSQSDE